MKAAATNGNAVALATAGSSPHRSRMMRLHALVGGFLAGVALGCREPEPARVVARPVAGAEGVMTEADSISVTRATVVAYFVIPPGAVDTMPDLAVEADDWNYGMSILADSLEAGGIAFAMTTRARVRFSGAAGLETTIALGAPLSAGYVFVRPGSVPCLRQGA